MADNDLKVIVKAKELAVHSFKLTSNCNRYPKKYRHSLVDKIQIKSIDIFEMLLEANRTNNVTDKRKRCETITKAITYCDDLMPLTKPGRIIYHMATVINWGKSLTRKFLIF